MSSIWHNKGPNGIGVPSAVAEGGPVLVTGAGGFLGVNLVWALREHGLPVRALLRRPPRGPQWHGLEGVEFMQGDICNPDQVARAMAGVRYVLHNAASTALVPRPSRQAYRVNVEGTRIVCAAAVQAGVRRLVFTSSLGTIMAGTAEEPSTEATPYNRRFIPTAYHTSKRLAEGVIREYANRGLETIIFTACMIIGPRDSQPTTNQFLLYQARVPQLLMLPPGGINIIDVREAALAHVRALWLGEPGHRYLLAGPYLAYTELGNLVKRIVGSPIRLRPLPQWTYLPGSLFFALVSGLLPTVPNALAVPNFQYGYVPFHMSGALADRTFGLHHRPASVTVYDTLRWFQDTGLAPWLKCRLIPPSEWEDRNGSHPGEGAPRPPRRAGPRPGSDIPLSRPRQRINP
jgi:dihydroflavonol-4-reductase